MKTVVLLLTFMLLLVGCAKPPEEVYSHPKTGKAQLTAHISECGEVAEKFGLVNMSPVHQYPMDDMKDRTQRAKIFNFCMLKKGYERGSSGAMAVDWSDVRIRVADTKLEAGDKSRVTISFNSPVAGLEMADLTAENAVLSNIATYDHGLTWTATLTPLPDVVDPENVVRLDNSGVIDRVSNIGQGVTLSNNYAVYSRHQSLTASATNP